MNGGGFGPTLIRRVPIGDTRAREFAKPLHDLRRPGAARLDSYSPRPTGRSRSHLPRPEEGAEGPAYPKQSQGAAAHANLPLSSPSADALRCAAENSNG